MSERRRYPRVESLNLVSVGEVQESLVGVARTLVVSEGGALLEMPQPYTVHTVFRLDLALGGDLLSVHAEVRDVAAGDDGMYQVGVRFTDLEPADRERLEQFIAERRPADDEDE
jgi:c-di-GMP-binding flagellar brake protein YcgR